MYFTNSLLKQLTHTAQSTNTASATILTNGTTAIADVAHTNAHMATKSVDVDVFEVATRHAPMGTTWTTKIVGADADRLDLAARAAIAMDTLTATVTTPRTLVIITTRQRAVIGAASTDIGSTEARLISTFMNIQLYYIVSCMLS